MASRWADRRVVPVDNLSGPRGGVADCMVWTDRIKPQPPPQPRSIIKSSDEARDFVKHLSSEAAKTHLQRTLEPNPDDLRIRAPTPADDGLLVTGRSTYRSTDQDMYSRSFTPSGDAQRVQETWRNPYHSDRYGNQRSHSKPEAFRATKAYLERYLNRPLSDQEIQQIVTETQKKMQADLERSATEEQLRRTMLDMKRPPEKYGAPMNWDQERNYLKDAKYLPRAPSSFKHDQVQSRPVSAAYNRSHHHPNTKHVTWDATPREVRLRHNARPGSHFDSWRPTNSYVSQNGSSSYSDVKSLEEVRHREYDAAKTRHPLSLGRTYAERINMEYPAVKSKQSSDPGKVNVQLDCAKDSDLTVSLRVQSRSGDRYM